MKRSVRNGVKVLALVSTPFAIGCGSEAKLAPVENQTTEAVADDPAPTPVEETPPATVAEPPRPESSYRTVADLPALSDESTKDDAGLGVVTIGDARIRDGIYLLSLKSGEGELEILMTLEARANGFALIRGNRRNPRTKLRWIVENGAVEFAIDGAGDPIAGRGAPAGDDWIQGTYRSENRAGVVAEGTFDLRKHQDPQPAPE